MDVGDISVAVKEHLEISSTRTGAEIPRGQYRCRTSTSRSGPEVTMFQNSLKVAKKAARATIGSAVEPVRVVRFKGPETVGGSTKEATVRKVAGRSDGESATPTSDRCGVRDCCVESEVGVGGGEGRCSGRETRETCGQGPPCDEEILQWMQDRQADLHDATLTGNHRSVEVVPRHGRCSHCVLEDSHSPVPLGQYRCVNVRGALYGLRGVRVGEAQNPGRSHAKRRRRGVSDSEISSSFLDGFEADLRNDVTQLSPTVPASSGAIARIVTEFQTHSVGQ